MKSKGFTLADGATLAFFIGLLMVALYGFFPPSKKIRATVEFQCGEILPVLKVCLKAD